MPATPLPCYPRLKNSYTGLSANHIQIGPTKTAPLLINPIEMRVLWTEIKYTKSAARLLDRVWVNKGGLDLSKEVLWVFVGQRTAELPAIKVGGLKKHSTFLERSKPPLLIQTLFKSLAALLMYFISVQSTLISIGFISMGAVFVGPICIYLSPCWQKLSSKKLLLCLWTVNDKNIYSRANLYRLIAILWDSNRFYHTFRQYPEIQKISGSFQEWWNFDILH